MEIAQLYKSTSTNQLQQSIYLCHKRNMFQILQVNILWQSQSWRSHHDAHLHPITNVPTKCQLSTPYRIQWIAQTRFSNSWSLRLGHGWRVKSRLHHEGAHLQPPTNIPTKYQLPTCQSFWDIAWKRFYRSRSLQQGQRLDQGHTKTLHTYNPQPMSHPNINFLHPKVSEI